MALHTANTNSTNAVNTANTASTNASAAVTTANTADTNATAALNNSRESDGSGGFVSAITKANTAITTANAANSANSSETDLHTTVNKLAEQMTMLSVELAKLKSKPSSNTSGANRFRCKNCVSANRRGSCPHCWECGSSDHKLRDCPESN